MRRSVLRIVLYQSAEEKGLYIYKGDYIYETRDKKQKIN